MTAGTRRLLMEGKLHYLSLQPEGRVKDEVAWLSV
jgi:hypothetical protein